MAFLLPLLPVVAPLVVQFMKWRGYSDKQIAEFLAWVHQQQRNTRSVTLPADQEAEARAKLRERIEKEKA